MNNLINNFNVLKSTFINTKYINVFLGNYIKNTFILVTNTNNKFNLNLKLNGFLFKVIDGFIIFDSKIFFKCFLGLISSFIFQLKTGFFLEIVLKGVGFNVYKKKRFLFFELGFSHYIGVIIPKDIIIRRFKARLAIFSFSKNIVHNFVKKLLLLKKVDAYKGKGVIYRNQKIILKEGKKR